MGQFLVRKFGSKQIVTGLQSQLIRHETMGYYYIRVPNHGTACVMADLFEEWEKTHPEQAQHLSQQRDGY